jgi:glucose-1-phosphatase
MLSQYKNIIFDFGGVILNIDYDLTPKAFTQLGINNFNELYSKATQTDLFDKLEKGLISPAAFRNEVKARIGKAVSDEQIDGAWNAMLLDLPAKRVDLLTRLGKQYNIFLLSNTNEIHYRAFFAAIQTKFNRNIFADCFRKAYFSHQVNMRKPDAEIFNLVLSENNLNPSETLFIDDSPQHIEGAKRCGLNTYWLDVKKEAITDLFT